MKAECVQVCLLIGLRALAECDRTAFDKATEVSPEALDERICSILSDVCHEYPGLAALYRNFRDAAAQQINTVDYQRLCARIRDTATQRARYYAAMYRSESRSPRACALA